MSNFVSNFTAGHATFADLASRIVGDGQTPNVYLVTHTASMNVWAIFVADGEEDTAMESRAAAIAFADRFAVGTSIEEPLRVQDRLTGLVHENQAAKLLREAEEYQERSEREEARAGSEDESRYWVDDYPDLRPFGPSSAAVVDEVAGGVVSYHRTLDDAISAMSDLRRREGGE